MRVEWILAALIFSAAASFVAHADDPAIPAPIASPADLDQSFLLLPSYDLERVGGGAVHVGDTVHFKITGMKQPAKTVDVPPGTEDLDEAGWAVTLIPPKANAQAAEPELTADVLKAGRLTLPSLALKDEKGISIARTNPFTITVDSAISPNDPKKDEPADLAPPVSLGFPKWVIAVAAVILLLVLGGVIYLLVRWSRRQRKPIPVVVAKPKSEDEQAFDALLELERAQLIQRGEFKKYYFRVSEILKTYLGSRFDFDAPESTTAEMMALLRGKKVLPDSLVVQIEELFLEMDVIKFTDTVPSAQAPLQILGVARSLVSQTKRPKIVEPVLGGAHAS